MHRTKSTECGLGYRYAGYQGSVVWGFWGIPTGFSVGMGWVWGLKSNPDGSLATQPQYFVYNRSIYFMNDFIILALDSYWRRPGSVLQLVNQNPFHELLGNTENSEPRRKSVSWLMTLWEWSSVHTVRFSRLFTSSKSWTKLAALCRYSGMHRVFSLFDMYANHIHSANCTLWASTTGLSVASCSFVWPQPCGVKSKW